MGSKLGRKVARLEHARAVGTTEHRPVLRRDLDRRRAVQSKKQDEDRTRLEAHGHPPRLILYGLPSTQQVSSKNLQPIRAVLRLA